MRPQDIGEIGARVHRHDLFTAIDGQTLENDVVIILMAFLYG